MENLCKRDKSFVDKFISDFYALQGRHFPSAVDVSRVLHSDLKHIDEKKNYSYTEQHMQHKLNNMNYETLIKIDHT